MRSLKLLKSFIKQKTDLLISGKCKDSKQPSANSFIISVIFNMSPSSSDSAVCCLLLLPHFSSNSVQRELQDVG